MKCLFRKDIKFQVKIENMAIRQHVLQMVWKPTYCKLKLTNLTHQRHANSVKESPTLVCVYDFHPHHEASNKVLFLKTAQRDPSDNNEKKAHGHAYHWQEHDNKRVTYDFWQQVPKVTFSFILQAWLTDTNAISQSLSSVQASDGANQIQNQWSIHSY